MLTDGAHPGLVLGDGAVPRSEVGVRTEDKAVVGAVVGYLEVGPGRNDVPDGIVEGVPVVFP